MLNVRDLEMANSYDESCNKSKRSKKTTQRQYELMINFIENHPKMINGKLTPSFTAQHRDNLWKELSNLLNSDGIGPEKPPEKWRKVSIFSTSVYNYLYNVCFVHGYN